MMSNKHVYIVVLALFMLEGNALQLCAQEKIEKEKKEGTEKLRRLAEKEAFLNTDIDSLNRLIIVMNDSANVINGKIEAVNTDLKNIRSQIESVAVLKKEIADLIKKDSLLISGLNEMENRSKDLSFKLEAVGEIRSGMNKVYGKEMQEKERLDTLKVEYAKCRKVLTTKFKDWTDGITKVLYTFRENCRDVFPTEIEYNEYISKHDFVVSSYNLYKRGREALKAKKYDAKAVVEIRSALEPVWRTEADKRLREKFKKNLTAEQLKELDDLDRDLDQLQISNKKK